MSETSAIAHFWAWWRDHRDDISAGLSSDDLNLVVDQLTKAVHRIDKRLSWEVAPASGRGSFMLVVSSGGDPELRAMARRWRKAAPTDDARWAFSDVRLPVAEPDGLTLDVGNLTVVFGDARFAVRESRAELDVLVSHPMFPDMPVEARRHIAFMILDATLGEEVVETWVGGIDVADEVADGLTPAELRKRFEELRAEFLTEDGTPAWAALDGETPRGPLVALARVPLKAVTAPEFDTHVQVRFDYADDDHQGLPGRETLAELQGAEDAIDGALGADGDVVASETDGNHRIVHAYVDATTDATSRVAALVRGWDARLVKGHVTSEYDPAWSAVAHLR